MLDRTIAPPLHTVQQFPIQRALTQALSNKVPLHIVSSGSQPILRLEVFFDAGNYHETSQGASFLMSKMMLEGTKKYHSKEIAELLAGYGAHLDVTTGNDRLTLTLTVLNKYLKDVLPVLLDILTACTFPKTNFEHIQNVTIEHLKINLEKTAQVAASLFRTQLFTVNSPYGYQLTPELIQNQTIASVVKNYNQTILGYRFEILVSGLVNEQVISYLDQYLGQIPVKFQGGTNQIIPSISVAPQKLYKAKENNVQCSLRIGKRMFTKKHPDYLKFYVLNEAFGGYFGSRLMKNIREDKGLTYGIHSQLVTLAHDGYFVIGADVKKENKDLALEEIYKEMKMLQEQPILDDELETVKNYIIGTYLGSLITPFQIADRFKAIHFNGLTYSFYDQYINNIQKISANELVHIAQKYLSPETMYEVVVG